MKIDVGAPASESVPREGLLHSPKVGAVEAGERPEVAALRLHPEERLQGMVDLEEGLTEEIEGSRPTLLLTNRRLLRYRHGRRADVKSIVLADIISIDIQRRHRQTQWVWVGLTFIAGGLLLAIPAIVLMADPVSPILMALSLALIGVVFVLTYTGAPKSSVLIGTRQGDIYWPLQEQALDDVADFVEQVHRVRLASAPNGEAER